MQNYITVSPVFFIHSLCLYFPCLSFLPTFTFLLIPAVDPVVVSLSNRGVI